MQARLILLLSLYLTACSTVRRSMGGAEQSLLQDSSLRTAHVGISVYDADRKVYLYNYGGDKYFVPASNTKIPTLYAAMKYLGDSLPALKVVEAGSGIYISGTGDPSFLHPDFTKHPAFDFLKSLDADRRPLWLQAVTAPAPFGSGWAWNDYDASYMSERSVFPIYGNLARFDGKIGAIRSLPATLEFSTGRGEPGSGLTGISRSVHANHFILNGGGKSQREIAVPFITSDSLLFRALSDTLKRASAFALADRSIPVNALRTYTVRSQPTDSLLKNMMHRSDNFFAEQCLLMAAHTLFGQANESRLIDTLLRSHLSDLPQRPRWADGSGLSRYNLFSPQDMVMLLDKMRTEFGMERMKVILPTGNEGTLSNYYKEESGYLFAKTGTLSGVVALSGYLYTRDNRLLIFSVLVNNHQASATAVRRAVERFVKSLRDR